VTRLVYLHGFRSSSQSTKAALLRRHVDALPDGQRPYLWVPDLPHRPAAAIALVAERIVGDGDPARTTFVGSSLGGFYATHLAERFGARAVMINPAVQPYDALAPALGAQTNLYTGEAFEVTQEHMDELRAMAVARITQPDRYFLLVETGDEVLDYREAVAFYAGANQFVRGGGDHTFTDFDAQLAAIVRFAGVPVG